MKNKSKTKRLISLALSFIMIASLFAALPVFADTADAGKTVYLNMESGSDENSGLSADAPLLTLGKALELAGNGGTIVAMARITVTPTTVGANSLVLDDLTVERGADYTKGALLYVQGSENNVMSLTLKNVTLDGKNITLSNPGNSDALVYLNIYSKLTIEDGAKLINNNSCAVCATGDTAVVEMTGGEISGNYTVEGSIACGGLDIYGGASFTMSGGVIKNNRTEYYFGGGVSVHNAGKFTMTGGEISYNYSHSGGGGVAVDESEFTMSGGKIINNTAHNDHNDETTWGGGIYGYDLTANNDKNLKITVSGGEISGNTADNGNAASVMTRCATTAVYFSGSPTIEGALDIGPAATAKAVNITEQFTPTAPVTLNLWGAALDTAIATYADGLTPNPFAFTSYNTAYAPTVSGQNVILANAVTVTEAPSANTLTYNEQAQALVKAGSVENGVLKYSLSENGEYGTDIPTATDAGEYTVWYYIDGNDTYADTERKSLSVNIAKATVTGEATFTPIKGHGKTLADAELTGDFSVDGALSWTVADTTEVKYNTEYTWKFVPENKNYEAVMGTVTVYSSCEAHGGGTATCVKKAVCASCGTEYGELVAHTYGDWTVTKEATESEKGSKEKTCSVCGDKITEDIAMLEKSTETTTVIDEEPSGLSGGAVAGIVIGVIAVLGIGGFAVYWFVIKKKKNM